MLDWKSTEINKLLKGQSLAGASASYPALPSSEEGEDGLPRGNMAFVIFLEPPDHVDPNMTFGERIIDDLIQRFSQKPTMVHVEVIIPPFLNPKSSKIHFATYLGSQAGYQNEYDAVSGVDFYLIRHGHRWRCIPVFGNDAIESLRAACDANVGSAYSLVKYPTSSHYFRKYSWIWQDKPMSSGHCATITARVLKQARIECGVVHRPPWYSPSSLYSALQSAFWSRLSNAQLQSLHPQSEEEKEEVEESIEKILRGPLSARSMLELGHSRCVSAIRELTYRVVRAAQDKENVSIEDRHICERELGDAVLKFCLLGREP